MLISACGDDQAAPQTAVTATVDRPTPEPAAKVAVADDAEKAEMAAADGKERTYDSVATSKLDNHGCPPYPSGGGQVTAQPGHISRRVATLLLRTSATRAETTRFEASRRPANRSGVERLWQGGVHRARVARKV